MCACVRERVCVSGNRGREGQANHGPEVGETGCPVACEERAARGVSTMFARWVSAVCVHRLTSGVRGLPGNAPVRYPVTHATSGGGGLPRTPKRPPERGPARAHERRSQQAMQTERGRGKEVIVKRKRVSKNER